jgi:hypothetical protein
LRRKDITKREHFLYSGIPRERERSVAICPIALMKYMRILSVHGAIQDFFNVGRKAMRSIISVRITVLSIFSDENQ